MFIFQCGITVLSIYDYTALALDRGQLCLRLTLDVPRHKETKKNLPKPVASFNCLFEDPTCRDLCDRDYVQKWSEAHGLVVLQQRRNARRRCHNLKQKLCAECKLEYDVAGNSKAVDVLKLVIVFLFVWISDI